MNSPLPYQSLVLLLAASLSFTALASPDFATNFPAVGQLPTRATLPDPLVMDDGRKVTTLTQWRQRREEMKQIIEYYAIGHSPPPPGNVIGHELLSKTVLAGKVTCRLVHLTFGPENKLGFDTAIFVPTKMTAGKPPFPTIVQPVFFPIPGTNALAASSWAEVAKQYDEPIRRGYAVVIFYYQQCGADTANYRQTGFFPAYPGYDWGDLAAWAWAMSRCVDYLETQPFVDKTKIIALGHSRLGKAALIAGAFDERFALTVPAGSGCGGTGAYRFNGKGRGGKEGLEEVVKRFPQWFDPRLREFSGQIDKLPFDQHWLISLVAPRCFIAADALNDRYCNVNALVQSYLAAKPVYEFLGVPEHLGVNFRPGVHMLAHADWRAILDFSDQQLRNRDVKQRFHF
jgi:(4-O-methyl)-D-glucuronate---lignin esterase